VRGHNNAAQPYLDEDKHLAAAADEIDLAAATAKITPGRPIRAVR